MDSSQLRREHDCLFGEIQLHPILGKIIDTREFQRLRRIKQLGGVDYVFKDATHTRYQHSIGTAYLAGLMVKNLQEIYTSIDDHDKICVQIAALCHDLGHGPYSYVFRTKVLPQLGLDTCKHKELAYDIFRKIWTDVSKEPDLKYELTKQDMYFIKELICGTPRTMAPLARHGRDDSKNVLYEIFSNETIPLDLCKFDYIARDCMNFGLLTGTDLDRLRSIRSEKFVMMVEDKIARNRDLIGCCNDLGVLHERVYQSAPVNAIEHMISDAFVWSAEYLHISNCMDNLDIFCELDDSILAVIKHASNVDRAIEVVRRLDSGDYYAFVAELAVPVWGIENITDKITECGINCDFIRMNKLRKKATEKKDIAENQKVIQVFCVNPRDKEVMRNIFLSQDGDAWNVLALQ